MNQECGQPHKHAVHFYQDSESLCRIVGDFLGGGLSSGAPAIVIATPPHREQIFSSLAERSINVQQARRAGELVVLDCDDTLGAFMLDGTPDAALFDSYMSTILKQVMRVRPRSTIRAYGEMVDVLWKAGRGEAAIKLETRWNALASRHPFSLLCGYSMGRFYKQPDFFDQVCGQHDGVIDSNESSAAPHTG
jgi:hypothetical protein